MSGMMQLSLDRSSGGGGGAVVPTSPLDQESDALMWVLTTPTLRTLLNYNLTSAARCSFRTVGTGAPFSA